jgi:hypothetical protein
MLLHCCRHGLLQLLVQCTEQQLLLLSGQLLSLTLCGGSSSNGASTLRRAVHLLHCMSRFAVHCQPTHVERHSGHPPPQHAGSELTQLLTHGFSRPIIVVQNKLLHVHLSDSKLTKYVYVWRQRLCWYCLRCKRAFSCPCCSYFFQCCFCLLLLLWRQPIPSAQTGSSYSCRSRRLARNQRSSTGSCTNACYVKELMLHRYAEFLNTLPALPSLSAAACSKPCCGLLFLGLLLPL